MATLFTSLSEKMSHIFSKLTKRGKLTELEIKDAMREVKLALLEADVNYLVVKDFVKNVSEKAVGDTVLKSLTPGQQVIKIVNEELVNLMSSPNQKLNSSSIPPTVIMMCGLQGAGKTTMCGKLAHYLKKQGKKTMLVACDIYRPAAINQLKVVASQAKCDVFERGTQNPVKTAKEALAFALKQGYDTEIIDTAGRLHINEELMDELKKTQLPIEICITSNTFTKKVVSKMEDHPIKELYDKGVFVTVNTDDPTFFKASLIDEYWNVNSKCGFTLDQILDLICNGFKASFISDSKKKSYCAQARKAWKEWFEAHPNVKA